MSLSPEQTDAWPWPVPEFALVLPPLLAVNSLAQTLHRTARLELAGVRPEWQRVYLGSDLCERLLPGPGLLRRWVEECAGLGLQISLLSPALSDAGVHRLGRLLPLLPAGTEVVITDWGALRRLRSHHAELLPVARDGSLPAAVTVDGAPATVVRRVGEGLVPPGADPSAR